MDESWADPKRTALLRAALCLFARKGALAPRVHDFARDAQVSLSALYDRFDGKGGIARVLISDCFEELDRHLHRACWRAKGLHARAEAIVAGTLDFAAQFPDAFLLLLLHGHLLCGEAHPCPGLLPLCVLEFAQEVAGAASPRLRAYWAWGALSETVKTVLHEQRRLEPEQVALMTRVFRTLLLDSPETWPEVSPERPVAEGWSGAEADWLGPREEESPVRETSSPALETSGSDPPQVLGWPADAEEQLC